MAKAWDGICLAKVQGQQCIKAADAGRDYCPEHALIFDICDPTDPQGKRVKCGKLREAGKAYCPKHNVLLAGWQDDQDRKMEKARNAKAAKKGLRDMLPESPLRGYNPEYDKRRGINGMESQA